MVDLFEDFFALARLRGMSSLSASCLESGGQLSGRFKAGVLELPAGLMSSAAGMSASSASSVAKPPGRPADQIPKAITTFIPI